MRRFRFVGVETESWLKPVRKGKSYPDDYFLDNGGTLISESRPKEVWQEVFETDSKPLHKDTDLGYYAGIYIQTQIVHRSGNPDIKWAITQAKELIKQLDNERDTI